MSYSTAFPSLLGLQDVVYSTLLYTKREQDKIMNNFLPLRVSGPQTPLSFRLFQKEHQVRLEKTPTCDGNVSVDLACHATSSRLGHSLKCSLDSLLEHLR